jgi:hypothetical protein
MVFGMARRWTMRPDMHKVIVERPRLGGHGARKGRRPRDLEDLPANLGMRRPYGHHGKDLNDHLGPLRRFLRKQVGRPWDKVYSEICAGLRSGHPLHDHLRRHVFDYVSLPGMQPRWRQPRAGDLYVDPRTGILRIVKPRRR